MTLPKRKAVTIEWNQPELHIYNIADTHVGSNSCNEDNISKLSDIIANDRHAIAFGGGDYGEAIAPSDYRWEPSQLFKPIDIESLDNMFHCQALRFCKLVEKSRKKWRGLVMGNHGVTAAHRYYINQPSIIAERLGIPLVGGTNQCGWFLIKFVSKRGKTRRILKVFIIHGFGGGELAGGLALKLQRLLWKKDADVLLMSHMHRPMVLPETVETIDSRGREISKKKIGVISYPLVDRHGYIARKGGNSPAVGYTRVIVKIDRTNEFSLGVDMREL